MVTRTPQQIITQSLQSIGAVAAGEQPTPAESGEAFARLTDLIDSWHLQPQMMLDIDRHVFTLKANQRDYTVGSALTSDLVIDRPPRLERVGLILPGVTPEIEKPINELTDDAWADVRAKTLASGLPTSYHYHASLPTGTFLVWPVPNQIVQVTLYTLTPIATMTSLTQSYVMAPGYARCLRLNLALELAPEYGRALPPLLQLQAHEALDDVQRANIGLVDLALDPAMTGGSGTYNILTDQ